MFVPKPKGMRPFRKIQTQMQKKKKPNIKTDLKKDDLMFIVYILLFCMMTQLNRNLGFLKKELRSRHSYHTKLNTKHKPIKTSN